MIDPNSLRIISNYVLVKPDPYHDEYNCGILTSSYRYDEKGQKHSTEMEHVSVSGVVYAVPGRLKFYAKQIWELQDNNDFRQGTFVRAPHVQTKIDYFRNQSVQYDVPIEIEIGDRVYFEYLAHQQSESILTADGMMMLIKYDMLILAQRNNEVKMLNGFVLVENEALGPQSVAGIDLVLDKTEKRIRNRAQATVVVSGAPVRTYLDFRGYEDGHAETGDIIMYDPRYAKELEYGLHRIFSDKRLLRIQRKDVYCIVDEKTPVISYI